MQKRKKRRIGGRGGGSAAAGGGSRRPTRTPTPEAETAETKRKRDEEEVNLGCPLVGEGQTPAHLDSYEKLRYEKPPEKPKDSDDPPFPVVVLNFTFLKIDERSDEEKENYMRHLGLLTEDDVRQVKEYRFQLKERKRRYRNLTYVPEYSENKKQRASYAWLYMNGDLSSPPLLRTRRRQRPAHLEESAAPSAADALSRPRSTRNSNTAANKRRISTPPTRSQTPAPSPPAPSPPAPPSPPAQPQQPASSSAPLRVEVRVEQAQENVEEVGQAAAKEKERSVSPKIKEVAEVEKGAEEEPKSKKSEFPLHEEEGEELHSQTSPTSRIMPKRDRTVTGE